MKVLPLPTSAKAAVTSAPRKIAVTAGFSHALPWLLSSLALVMVTLIGPVPIWMLVIFAGSIIWRQRIEIKGGRMPSLLVRLAVFLPATAGVLLQYGTHPGAKGMLTFLVALLALKVLELRSHRDFIVVALLGFFMILSAFFYNQALALSLYLALAVAVNTIALIRCHDGGRRRARRASARLALVLMAQAVPLVVLLFVIFPRLHGNFLLQLSGATVGRTGMSDHLQPGSINTVVQSDERAFRAVVNGGAGVAARNLYWRGLVLGICESSMSWRAADSSSAPEPIRPPPLTPGGALTEQTITIIAQNERILFGLDRPVRVKPSGSFKPVLVGPFVLRSPAPVITTSVYTVFSDLNAKDPVELSASERRFYTVLPKDLSPKVLALTRKWTSAAAAESGAARENDILRQARLFFRDGGFTYTLNPGVLPPDNALEHFLFRSRRGFCEHYAAAFTSLMRTAGLPARIVVGYQGGEYNSWGGRYYLVRQSDAHAWAEVWITGKGWQREDPTAVVAPERVSFGAQNYAALTEDGPLTAESRLERLSRLNSPGIIRWVLRNSVLAWDSMDQQWNMLVLGYDKEKQADTLQGLGLGNLDWLEGALLSLLAAFSLLVLGALSVRAMDHRRAGPADPAAQLYQRFCRQVARLAGLERATSEGPLDFSRRAVQALPAEARQINAITELYVRSRYASPVHADLASRTLEAFGDAVEKFRALKPKPAPDAGSAQ